MPGAPFPWIRSIAPIPVRLSSKGSARILADADSARWGTSSDVPFIPAHEPLQILGKGSRRQNYVDIRDVAAAVEACLTKQASGIYNIAATDSISNYELAQTCISELGSSASIDFAGKPDPEEGTVWDVSVSKASRDLGYRPRFTIRDSIRSIAEDQSRRDTE